MKSKEIEPIRLFSSAVDALSCTGKGPRRAIRMSERSPAMNRKHFMWCLLPSLVLSAGLHIGFAQADTQKKPDRGHSTGEQAATPWQSSARLRRFMGTENGTLVIGGEGIEFRSGNGRSMKRPFLEIQTFLLSPQTLTIKTYENRKDHLPGMQRFRFDLDRDVPPKIAAELASKVQRPSRNTVPDQTSQGVLIPAHHRTLTGGTNGFLRISDRGLAYETGVRGDSRSWRWADLQTVSDPDPFHLLVFGYRDTYAFDLKAPLSHSLYYKLVDAIDAQDGRGQAHQPGAQSPQKAERNE